MAEIFGKESVEECAESAVGLFTVQGARQLRLSHCQGLGAAKEVEGRFSTQQVCSVLFDFLSSQHDCRTS